MSEFNHSMIFKTMNGDWMAFNKTIISTRDNLKNLQTVNTTVYNQHGKFNLQGLAINQSESVSDFTKINNAVSAYNSNLTKSTQLQNAYVSAIGNQNKSLENYLAGLNGTKASMGGYIKSLIGAKAATIGLQVASAALNMAISMGLSFAISALVSAIVKYVNKGKEAREQAIENANIAKQESENLTELLNKYNQLSEEVKTNTNAKDNLLSTQEELLRALGIEQSEIDALITKYGDLSTAINQVSLDALKDSQAELLTGYSARKDELLKAGSDGFWGGNNIISASGEDSVKAFKTLEKAGIIDSESYGTGGGVFVLTGDDSTVEGILENYNRLETAQEALNEAISNGEYTKEEMSANPLYNAIQERIKEIQSAVDNYNSAINDVNANAANQKIISSLMGKELPDSKEEFEDFKNSLIKSAQASNDFIGSQEDISNAVINALAKMPEFKQYFEDLNKAQNEFDIGHKIDNFFTDSLSQIESLSKNLEQIAKIYNDVQDKGNFDYSSILNNEDFKNTFGEYTEQYDNFIKTITNSPDDIDACQSAFNELVTAYIYGKDALGNLNDENAKAITLMLEQKGIANAEKLVTNALAATHEYAAWAKDNEKASTENLAKATWEDLAAFYAESSASVEAKNHIVAYYLQKQLAAGLTLDTSGDVQNLLTLVKALGGTTTALQAYYRAKANEEYYESKANEYESITASTSGLLLQPSKIKFDPLKNKYVTIDPQKEAKEYRKKAQEQANIANKELGAAQAEIEAAVANVSLNSTVKYNAPTSNLGGSSAATETKETFNWIETALSRIQRTITNLGKTVSATWRSWTDRNNALKEQVSAVTQEISLQEQAYNRYIALANGVGLPEPYRSLVENGAIDISTITDEGLAEQIKTYQDYYEKALACKDATADLRDELASLVQTKFDQTVKQYDDRLSMHEHQSKMLQSSADILETKGYMVGAGIYDSLARQEEEKLAVLREKYASLEAVLNSSDIPKYSEQWYAMQLEILGVKEEIEDSTKALAEYNNTLQELDWNLFDKLQEKLSSVNDEADFLTELMSDKKMYHEDGSATEHGQAALGLHAVKYNNYMAQADEYAAELSQINAQLANDPYNQKLLERRNELLEQQREMILSAEKEKQSMKDLRSEGYDTLLNSMNDIISKRKEMLSQIKDLSDYEKSIKEQTAEVTRYQKMLDSMQGMADTEEGQATIQKYELSLKQAKENLEESEYDRYIKDQEQLLYSLYDETESWINSRLDDLDTVIKEIIRDTNENAAEIQTTLQTETEKVGTSLTSAMESIWSPNGSYTSVVSNYGSQQLTTLKEILTTFKDYISDMQKDTEEKVKEETVTNTTPSATGSTAHSNTLTGNTSGSNGGWQQSLISKKDSYPKGKLHKDTSIVDLLKYLDKDSSFHARENLYRAMGGSGLYVGSSSQNLFMMRIMNSAGYKEGSSYIPYDQSNWIHSDELLYRSSDGGLLMPLNSGDKVFTKEMTARLWNMAQPVWKPNLPTYDLNKLGMKNTENNNVHFGDIHFDLPNVHNADEFITELQHSNRFEKIIKEMTCGGMLGKNRYNKYKY